MSNLMNYREACEWLAAWRAEYGGRARLLVRLFERVVPEQEANFRAIASRRKPEAGYARSIAMLRRALRAARPIAERERLGHIEAEKARIAREAAEYAACVERVRLRELKNKSTRTP